MVPSKLPLTFDNTKYFRGLQLLNGGKLDGDVPFALLGTSIWKFQWQYGSLADKSFRARSEHKNEGMDKHYGGARLQF